MSDKTIKRFCVFCGLPEPFTTHVVVRADGVAACDECNAWAQRTERLGFVVSSAAASPRKRTVQAEADRIVARYHERQYARRNAPLFTFADAVFLRFLGIAASEQDCPELAPKGR